MITIDIVDDDGKHWIPSRDRCQAWLQCALDQSSHPARNQDCELSLRLVDEEEMTRLNSAYRQKNSVTNVLSFPSELPDTIVTELQYFPLGDIAICPVVLEHEATSQEKELEAHWAHLLIHGLLHLLGHDHMNDEQASAMESLEINTLKILGFSNPYLIG
ncbi:MAG: rRNA maturation RNase YbeY [Proteobacteria bacterium]|jgi:probable rRNA maturation factor|nr:rRNA maturation RNase YbeY [Pseudomonadota bacterium]MDA0928841.1 rRNA maturation RNase YbeY [Pseudomonadota bacterium]